MEKNIISRAEFEKRIEIEAINLMYFERLKKEEAFKQAKEYIKTKFVYKNEDK